MPAARHAGPVPRSGSRAATQASITASASARAPRPRQASPRAGELSRDIQRQLVLGQLGLQALDATAGPGQRRRLRGRLRLASPGRQPLDRSGVTGPAALHNVRGVQPLPTQQGALVTVAGRRRRTARGWPACTRPRSSAGEAWGAAWVRLHPWPHHGRAASSGLHRHRSLGDPVSPLRDGRLPQASHVTLTERASSRNI